MTSIRKLKKQFFRRQWFSSEQRIVLDDGRVDIYPMKRHGLAYDDTRARTGIRWPSHGKHALQDMPYDTLHQERKDWKKIEKADDAVINQKVREIRRKEFQIFMTFMSFKTLKKFYLDYLYEGCKDTRELVYKVFNDKAFFNPRVASR